MKNINIYFAILALIFCTSCSDWLDVRPRSQVKSEVLLSTEAGFKSALIGSYIDISSPSLYGKNTSFYLPECLSRTWVISPPAAGTQTSKDQMYYLGTFNYTEAGVESLIDRIWSKYYNTIAQLNNVVTNIKTPSIKFEYDNDKLILGEALGLRAFCHLELLRYFGPVPGENLDVNQKTIPYLDEFTREEDKMKRLTYSEVISMIELDLDNAQKELSIDPILKYPNKILNAGLSSVGPMDTWQYNRQNRFNYFAVLATKARFYNWIGDKAKAYDYALQVINAINEDNSLKFELTTESTFTTLEYRSEHLFAIHRPTLENEARIIFGQESSYLTQTIESINTAYEDTDQPSDIRMVLGRYWEEKVWGINSVKINHFKKYTGNNIIKATNMVPIIRLTEMYFLGMENAPSLAESKSLFETYRISRALVATTFDKVTDKSSLLSRLEKEYIKEFIGEGQVFFFYKKNNYPNYNWPAKFTLPVGAYVIPIPKSQMNFDK